MAKRAGIEKLVTYQYYLRKHSTVSEHNNDELFALYSQATTEEEKIKLRNEIIESNLLLVAQLIAFKYNYNYDVNPVYDMDDIIQEANLLLVRIIDKYDCTKGKFSTFLAMKILPYVYYSSGLPNSPFHFNRGLAAQYKKVKKLMNLDYDDEFISTHCNIPLKKVKMLRSALQNSLSYEELLEKGSVNDSINECDLKLGDALIEGIIEEPIITTRNERLFKDLNSLSVEVKDLLMKLYGLNNTEPVPNISVYSEMVGKHKQTIYQRHRVALEKLSKDYELKYYYYQVDEELDAINKRKTYYLQK